MPKSRKANHGRGKRASVGQAVRDSQRKKVYGWEQLILPHVYQKETPRLSLPACQALVDLVWREHETGLPAPVVKDGRGRRSAAAYGTSAIKLPRWSRVSEVVLHEISHALLTAHAQAHQVSFAAHGPEFAAVFIDLLSHYMSRQRQALLSAAAESNVRVAQFSLTRSPGLLSPSPCGQ